MSKGRNSTRVTVRLPDNVLEAPKATALKNGIGYTVMIRYAVQRELGMKQQ
jgi:predicted DNA binding CopG/RHH family protein